MPVGLPVVGTDERKKFQALFPVYGQHVDARMVALMQSTIYQTNYQASTCPDKVYESLAAWGVGLLVAYYEAGKGRFQEGAVYALNIGDSALREIKEELWGPNKVKSRFSD